MDDTSSNGPLAAAQAWNEKQAAHFRRSHGFDAWWGSGDRFSYWTTREIAHLAWLTASLQAEESARAELQDELARLKGGAK
jgi:hypothetical protein